MYGCSCVLVFESPNLRGYIGRKSPYPYFPHACIFSLLQEGAAAAHLCVVMRHLREEVVRDMRIGNVVVQVVEQPAVVAVNSGQRPPHPVPLIVSVVGQVCRRGIQAGRGGKTVSSA